MHYRAVIFDLGGVVLPSPFEAFRSYERARGLPHRFVSDVIVHGGATGAWSRFERGELAHDDFVVAFEAECRDAGGDVVVAELFGSMQEGADVPRPAMVTAIRAIRAHGLHTAALTNNWADAHGDTRVSGPSELARRLDGLFDTIVESARVGLNKPDPRIYRLVCERLGVRTEESVFLDDLGANLKPARELGMATIKVADPDAALAELASLLEIGLDGR